LLTLSANKLGGVFLGTAADLADHDDAFGLRSFWNRARQSMKSMPLDGIAADTDAGALAELLAVVWNTAS
jgi:hypothetical protein